MEVPRLGVDSELQMPAYATATAMQEIQTHVLMDTSRIHLYCTTTGTPENHFSNGSSNDHLALYGMEILNMA